jgi:hypothetical protein
MSRSALRYGLYPWWIPAWRTVDVARDPFEDLVHPHDLQTAIAVVPLHKLLVNVGSENDYLILRYGCYVFRAKPSDLWQPKAGEGFLVDDEVDVLPRGGRNTPKRGIIHAMGWHFRQDRPVYRITVDGKLLKKEYKGEDLAIVRPLGGFD